MPFLKSQVKKILVISLSNIGDVVLTFPVMDILRRDFPESFVKIVVGPKAAGLLKGNPHFQAVEVFDKHQSVKKTISWVIALRQEKFDLVVDLRNTAIPFLLSSPFHTPYWRNPPKEEHMRGKHLARLKSAYPYGQTSSKKVSFYVFPEEQKAMDLVLSGYVHPGERFVVIAPGAANRDKRFSEEGFAFVCDEIIKRYSCKIVFVGDWEDKKISCRIMEMMNNKPLNLCGDTSLRQSGYVISKAYFVIVNDSAPMHLASYFNVPTLAIFGPSNPSHYGPWGDKHIVIHNNRQCVKCKNPSSNELHTCMAAISADDVLTGLNNLSQMISSHGNI